jgi:hypothetical protein
MPSRRGIQGGSKTKWLYEYKHAYNGHRVRSPTCRSPLEEEGRAGGRGGTGTGRWKHQQTARRQGRQKKRGGGAPPTGGRGRGWRPDGGGEAGGGGGGGFGSKPANGCLTAAAPYFPASNRNPPGQGVKRRRKLANWMQYVAHRSSPIGPVCRADFTDSPKYRCTQGGAATRRECGTSLKSRKQWQWQ